MVNYLLSCSSDILVRSLRAGFYNTDGCNGASEYAVNNMPPNVEMVYSDVGDEVITGRRLSYCTNERNPCRAALEDQQGFGNGRCSWDPVVTLRAVRSGKVSKNIYQK